MIIYTILLVGMIISVGGMIFSNKLYALLSMWLYMQAPVLGGYLMTDKVSILILGSVYSTVLLCYFKKWNISFKVDCLRFSVVLGIIFSMFIAGAVYFIFATLDVVVKKQSVLPEGLSGHYWLNAFLVVLVSMAITFGIWGITRRRPSYLSLFSGKVESPNATAEESE